MQTTNLETDRQTHSTYTDGKARDGINRASGGDAVHMAAGGWDGWFHWVLSLEIMINRVAVNDGLKVKAQRGGQRRGG